MLYGIHVFYLWLRLWCNLGMVVCDVNMIKLRITELKTSLAIFYSGYETSAIIQANGQVTDHSLNVNTFLKKMLREPGNLQPVLNSI